MDNRTIPLNEFAKKLGFESSQALLDVSEVTHEDFNTSWLISQLPTGRWAAWQADGIILKLADTWVVADDLKVSLGHTEFFETPEEAEAYNQDA